MAGHRSSTGTRARRAAGAARHHSADRPAPAGPSLRATVVASAAAVGAVATGTFTALLPTPGDSATTAGAAESLDGTLAASSTTLTSALAELPASATGMLAPVTFETAAIDGTTIADEHLAQLDKAAEMAEELAARQAEERRIAAERAELDALIAEGGVDGWIAAALDLLDLPQSYAPGVKEIIMAESNGNPRAINNWDSNARAGTPSQGLMQTIPSTFRAYVHPDLADKPITHPVANITAGIRYMIATYGADTLAAGGRTDAGGSYIGY
ncbi:MAG: transglycosylase SLT domain-containing protein [Pseudonocardia sp.]|nr:transglycosylase SLT domain-containing protein [Pseudonocardia sp.]